MWKRIFFDPINLVKDRKSCSVVGWFLVISLTLLALVNLIPLELAIDETLSHFPASRRKVSGIFCAFSVVVFLGADGAKSEGAVRVGPEGAAGAVA